MASWFCVGSLLTAGNRRFGLVSSLRALRAH
jgi:hypothetical protein